MALSDNRNLGRKLGLLGTVALFSGLFAGFFIVGRFGDPWVFGQLIVAALCTAFYFATNVSTLSENFSGRGTMFLVTSVVSAVVLAGALGAVNYIVVKKPKTWDLTKDQIFTLSDQTTGTLKGLTEEVKVLAFYGWPSRSTASSTTGCGSTSSSPRSSRWSSSTRPSTWRRSSSSTSRRAGRASSCRPAPRSRGPRS